MIDLVVVLGAINWDINLYVKRFPEIGEEISVEKIIRVPGGKAANVAVAAARILGSGHSSLIGCLGKDEIAETQIKILKEEGVVTSGIKTYETESGQAYILIDENGRNVINTFFGANLELTKRHLYTPMCNRILRNASIIAVIDPPLETIQEVVLIGKKEGKIVVWDAGVRSTANIKLLKKILRNVDYLVINQVETKNLTGEKDPVLAWEILSKINPNIILVAKLGEKGCIMIKTDEIIKVKAINLENAGMKIVNTVGCGDAFLGVFISSKHERFSDEESLERANLAGAIKATKQETRGSPYKNELEKYIKFKENSETTKRK